jgi:hypothetical protein
MSNTLTTVFTGCYKIISPLHNYDKESSTEDVIIIITSPYDGIVYIVVNSTNNKLIVRKQLACLDDIKNKIIQAYPQVRRDDLVIDAVFGIHNTSNNSKITTVFIVIKHICTLKNYMIQLDINNHKTNNINITGLSKFFDTNNVYFDTTITTNTTINDTKTINDTDAYITFVAAGDNNSLSSADIEGVRVLVTDNEKEEFMNGANILLPDQIYPIVDVWSTIHRKFFKLTEDTNKIRLNFSTGLGFIGFDI